MIRLLARQPCLTNRRSCNIGHYILPSTTICGLSSDQKLDRLAFKAWHSSLQCRNYSLLLGGGGVGGGSQASETSGAIHRDSSSGSNQLKMAGVLTGSLRIPEVNYLTTSVRRLIMSSPYSTGKVQDRDVHGNTRCIRLYPHCCISSSHEQCTPSPHH